jgi:hypothetical protein
MSDPIAEYWRQTATSATPMPGMQIIQFWQRAETAWRQIRAFSQQVGDA